MKSTLIKILLPIVVLALGYGAMLGIQASAPEKEEKEKVDTRPFVKVERARARDHQVIITSFGEVTPVESTILAAQVSGEVTSWNDSFVPGGVVRRGETLFTIEKDTYEAALLKAQADLSLAKANLIEEQARADVAKREAKQLPKAKVSDLYLRKPQLIGAKASVKSAQARLKIAQRDLDNCEIKAPYDALIIERNIGTGQYVMQGSQAATLNNIERAEITFPVAAFDSPFLHPSSTGNAATVVNNGLNSFQRVGFVARDLGVVDQATRMSQLVVTVDDPYSLKSEGKVLKFGSYVEVNFDGLLLQNVYRLPQDWVTNRTVWVVDENKQLLPKSVDVLREEGQYFLINAGLDEGDRLVTTIPEYPQKGMDVKIAGEDDVLEKKNVDEASQLAVKQGS